MSFSPPVISLKELDLPLTSTYSETEFPLPKKLEFSDLTLKTNDEKQSSLDQAIGTQDKEDLAQKIRQAFMQSSPTMKGDNSSSS